MGGCYADNGTGIVGDIACIVVSAELQHPFPGCAWRTEETDHIVPRSIAAPGDRIEQAVGLIDL